MEGSLAGASGVSTRHWRCTGSHVSNCTSGLTLSNIRQDAWQYIAFHTFMLELHSSVLPACLRQYFAEDSSAQVQQHSM